MNRRKAIALIAAAPLALVSRDASAGGMGIFYLVGDPAPALAGVPWSLRFALLGHDMVDHLWCGADVTITLMPKDGGEQLTFLVPGKGSKRTEVGIYSTEITIPVAGAYKWNLSVEGWAPTFFPTLEVADPKQTSAPPESDGHRDVGVEIQVNQFSPSEVTVYPNTTVRWVNTDPQSAHQITWKNLDMDDSAPIRRTGEFSCTFAQVGRYDYFCGPHPDMTGSIIVSDD